MKYLYAKIMRQRAKALIEMTTHPNHRETLERSPFDRFHSYGFERTIY